MERHYQTPLLTRKRYHTSESPEKAIAVDEILASIALDEVELACNVTCESHVETLLLSVEMCCHEGEYGSQNSELDVEAFSWEPGGGGGRMFCDETLHTRRVSDGGT